MLQGLVVGIDFADAGELGSGGGHQHLINANSHPVQNLKLAVFQAFFHLLDLAGQGVFIGHYAYFDFSIADGFENILEALQTCQGRGRIYHLGRLMGEGTGGTGIGNGMGDGQMPPLHAGVFLELGHDIGEFGRGDGLGPIG